MRRENIQSKLLFGLCLLVCLCGCNSFLNVQPKGTVEQGKQFKDVQGYRDAMYGILCLDGTNEPVRESDELRFYRSGGAIVLRSL